MTSGLEGEPRVREDRHVHVYGSGRNSEGSFKAMRRNRSQVREEPQAEGPEEPLIPDSETKTGRSL